MSSDYGVYKPPKSPTTGRANPPKSPTMYFFFFFSFSPLLFFLPFLSFFSGAALRLRHLPRALQLAERVTPRLFLQQRSLLREVLDLLVLRTFLMCLNQRRCQHLQRRGVGRQRAGRLILFFFENLLVSCCSIANAAHTDTSLWLEATLTATRAAQAAGILIVLEPSFATIADWSCVADRRQPLCLPLLTGRLIPVDMVCLAGWRQSWDVLALSWALRHCSPSPVRAPH